MAKPQCLGEEEEIAVNMEDIVDNETYAQLAEIPDPALHPFADPQQLDIDALLEETRLQLHSILLSDISRLQTGSTADELNQDLLEVSRGAMSLDRAVDIFKKKFGDLDNVKRKNLLRLPQLGDFVKVLHSSGKEYHYRAKSTLLLNPFVQQLHYAYNSNSKRHFKRDKNKDSRLRRTKLQNIEEKRLSMHFCNYIVELIKREIAKSKNLKGNWHRNPQNYEQVAVLYQKIDDRHRSIVTQKTGGPDSDLYEKYRQLLRLDEMTAFKSLVSVFGTRSSMIKVLDCVPLFRPIGYKFTDKKAQLYIFIQPGFQNPNPYSNKDIEHCIATYAECSDSEDSDRDIIRRNENNHRHNESAYSTATSNQSVHKRDMFEVSSDSVSEGLYSDEEKKMDSETLAEWKRRTEEREQKREERKKKKKEIVESMRMEGFKTNRDKDLFYKEHGQMTFFGGRIRRVERNGKSTKESTNSVDEEMFYKEVSIMNWSSSEELALIVERDIEVEIAGETSYESQTDASHNLPMHNVSNRCSFNSTFSENTIIRTQLLVQFIYSAAQLVQLWTSNSGILLTALHSPLLQPLFSPESLSLFFDTNPSILHMQLIQNGCQIEPVNNTYSISVSLSERSSAFCITHYVQLLITAAKLAKLNSSAIAVSSLHTALGLPAISEVFADSSVTREIRILLRLQSISLIDMENDFNLNSIS